MTPAQRYADLEKMLIELRKCGGPEEIEDGMMDELMMLWLAMTQAERDEANKRAAHYNKTGEYSAPATLDDEEDRRRQ